MRASVISEIKSQIMTSDVIVGTWEIKIICAIRDRHVCAIVTVTERVFREKTKAREHIQNDATLRSGFFPRNALGDGPAFWSFSGFTDKGKFWIYKYVLCDLSYFDRKAHRNQPRRISLEPGFLERSTKVEKISGNTIRIQVFILPCSFTVLLSLSSTIQDRYAK